MARKLIVEIVGDSSSLERSFGRSAKAAGQFDRQVSGTFQHVDAGFTRLQKIAVGGLVGGAAFAGLKSSLDAASDLQEQMTKVGQVFKSSADETVAWSKTTADAFGVSQRAALTAAGTFGNLFNTVGLAPQKAAAMSRSLVELAADLASFNNVDPGDALDALRSGLIGEAEPLRRFGVLLSETRVQQEAMRETGKKTAASLTDQEKALARYTIILKDTAPAHGDFARTSDGAANASRRLSANLADLQANLASGLVPTLGKVTGALADLTSSMQAVQITAGQLASDKGLRDKFADAFGVQELFDALNKITSEGLKTRPDEGTVGAATEKGKATGSAVGDAFAKALEDAIKAAKAKVAAAIQKGSKALAINKNLDALDLGITQAGITESLTDDLAALERYKAGLEQAIRAGVEVAANQRKLAQTQKDINDTRAQIKQEASANRLALLDLGIARAANTEGLGDDLAALEHLKAGLEKEIRAGNDVVSNQQRLAGVVGDIAETQKKIAANAADAIQAQQFRALGLDSSGNKPPPAIENLKKQLAQLSSRDDLTGNQKGLLSRIRKVLVDPINQAKEPTRAAIQELFATMRSEFKKGSDDLAKGPATKGSAFQLNKFLEGLKVDPQLLKQLEQRFTRFSPAGLGQIPIPKTGTFGTGGGTTINLTVESILDGEKVGRSTKRFNQNDRRHNAPSRR